MVVTLHDIN